MTKNRATDPGLGNLSYYVRWMPRLAPVRCDFFVMKNELRSWWFCNADGWKVYADCKNDVIYDCSLPKFINRPVNVLAGWMRKGGGGFSFEEIPIPKTQKERE